MTLNFGATILLLNQIGPNIKHGFPHNNLFYNNIIGIQDLGNNNAVGVLSNYWDSTPKQQNAVNIILIRYFLGGIGKFQLCYMFAEHKTSSYELTYLASPTVLIMDIYYKCLAKSVIHPVYTAITTTKYNSVQYHHYDCFNCTVFPNVK